MVIFMHDREKDGVGDEDDEMFMGSNDGEDAVNDLEECIVPVSDMPVKKKKEEKKEGKKSSGFDAIKAGDLRKLPDFIEGIKDPDTLRLIAMKLHVPEDALVNIGPPLANVLLKYSPLFLPTDKMNSDNLEKYSMLLKDVTPIFKAIADTVAHSGEKPAEGLDEGEVQRFIKGYGDDEEKESVLAETDETKIKIEGGSEEKPVEMGEKNKEETDDFGIPSLEDMCREQGKNVEDVIKSDYYYQARNGETPIPNIVEHGGVVVTEESKDFDVPGMKEAKNEINNMKMDPKYVVKEVVPVVKADIAKEEPDTAEEVPTLTEKVSEKEIIIEEKNNIPDIKKETKKEEK